MTDIPIDWTDVEATSQLTGDDFYNAYANVPANVGFLQFKSWMLKMWFPGLGPMEIAFKRFEQIKSDLEWWKKVQNDISHKHLKRLADKLAVAARGYSPYLYGILRSAHSTEVHDQFPDWLKSIVFIDPDVTHPILGGQPNVYGAEIHAGMRGAYRPWFEWMLANDGDNIVNSQTTEIMEDWDEILKGTTGN